LSAGSTSGSKCDFSNAGKYSSYVSNKKVASGLNVFVDFTFTLDHPVIGGGKIVVVLDGMARSLGSGIASWVYVSKGLTASGTTISAGWDGTSTDTISISGYKSSSSAPTITFTAQVNVAGGDCLKSITSYASDLSTIID